MLCSAQKARLLSEEEDPRDPNNVLYVGYCSNHYGKQVNLSILKLCTIKGAMIHDLGVLIYCCFCITIQRYILYDTVKCELADFYR